jgi:hypothetical protein
MMPAAAHGMRPFKVIAVNVNGLAAPDKRKPFFAWLQQQGCDIALLSETHSRSDQQVKQWVQKGAGQGRPWQGPAFFHHKPAAEGERATAGVAVLLSQWVLLQDSEPESSCRCQGLAEGCRLTWGGASAQCLLCCSPARCGCMMCRFA